MELPHKKNKRKPSMKVDASIEGNELLNQQFQSKELVGQAFYKQLKMLVLLTNFVCW